MLHCMLGMDNNSNPLCTDMMTTILNQYHISKGINFFGKDGVDAVLAELKQLHNRMVIDPRDTTNMTKEERHATLHDSLSNISL